MRGHYIFRTLTLNILFRVTSSEFTDLTCQPSQRATSQTSQSECQPKNLTGEALLDSIAQFAHFHEEHAPAHIFNFIESARETRPQGIMVATGEVIRDPPSPQFTGDLVLRGLGLQNAALAWMGGSQAVGDLSVNMTCDMEPLGDLHEYPQQEFFVPQRPIGGPLTGIAHGTGELMEPTKVRRFLKVVKRAACVTPTDVSCIGQTFCCQPTATCIPGGCTVYVTGCLYPTDHLCPGSDYCCAPTATCASVGCTTQVAPICATAGDHLCPGSSFCCKPTATCVSNGCQGPPTCATPGDYSCVGATFCCAPTATCAGNPPTGCTISPHCATTTDYLCPGSSFCCQPSATCVSTGCIGPLRCSTTTDTICPNSLSCCPPSATCIPNGCVSINPCLTPTDHICPGSSFCCAPTATCVSDGCQLPCSAGYKTCSGQTFCCPSAATCVANGCTAPPSCTNPGYTVCGINTSWCCPSSLPCVAAGASVVCGNTPPTHPPPPPSSAPPPPPPPPPTSAPPPPPPTSAPPPPPQSTQGPTPTSTSNSNVAIFNSIANDLFPPGNGPLVTSVAKALCSQFAVPAINSVIAGQESRARGVVDLVQNCIKLINNAEPPPAAGKADVVFNLALGNLALCDKLSNTILEGTLVQGQSDFCNAVQAL